MTALARILVVAVTLPFAASPMRGQGARCDAPGYRVASRTVVGATVVGSNVALHEYFRRAWWSGERADRMWVNWERHEPFREQDKFGHAWGGFHLARLGGDLLEGACIGDRKAAWWGAAYAAAFQLQIEIWDGHQAEYGFSPPDVAANTAGAGLVLAQHYQPGLRAVKPTISYLRTAASKKFGRAQGSELRPTTDYSGQTYWLSFDVESMLPSAAQRWWPGLLRASLGHSITDYVSPITGRGLSGRREWVLSLDVDPEKLPGNHPIWNRVKHELSYYRFPAPAIVLTPRARGVRWYR